MIKQALFIIMLLLYNISFAAGPSVAGQLEPDKDLVFAHDIRTKTKVVSVQSYNAEILNYYAREKNLARIASFDGGGIRGICEAYWSACIEHATNKSMGDIFNLLAGTSTGGIMATGLTLESSSQAGKSMYSAEDIFDYYINESNNIFTPRGWLGYLLVSKYKTKPAYDSFDRIFKNTKLSQIRSDCDLLVTYYNLTNNRPGFFKSHKAKDPTLYKEKDFYLKDVVASTTAAPTYFKEFKLYTAYSKDQPEILKTNCISAIDGGLTANDPSICALVEGLSLYRNADAFLMVSMGTGRCITEACPKGLLSWAYNISDILMKNTSEMTDHVMKKFGMYSSRPVFFSRFQCDISEAHRSMDNKSPKNIAYLVHQAQSAHEILDKIKKLGPILKETDKPLRDILVNESYIEQTSFLEI